MNNTVILLYGGWPKLINLSLTLGFSVLLIFDDNDSFSDTDLQYCLDYLNSTNEHEITEKIQSWKDAYSIKTCISTRERKLLPAALVCTQLGIHNTEPTVISNINNKILFRAITNPSVSYPVKYIATQNIHEAQCFLNSCQNNAIMKPVNGVGSQDIFLLKPTDTIHLSHNSEYILEEYIRGEEFSIEAVSLNGEHHIIGVTKKYTRTDQFYYEVGHIFPYKFSSQVIVALINIEITRLLNSLKFKTGVTHIEIKIDGDEIRVVEVNCRCAGDNISRLCELAYGYDLNELNIAIRANGGKEEIKNYLSYSNNSIRKEFAVLYFHGYRNPFESEIEMEEYLKKIIGSNLIEYSLSHNNIGPTENSYTRFGYCIFELNENLEVNKLLKDIYFGDIKIEINNNRIRRLG